MDLSGDEAEEVPSGFESDPEGESEGEGDWLGEDEFEFQFNDFIRQKAAELHKTEEEIYKMMADGKLTDEPTLTAEAKEDKQRREEKEHKRTVTPHLRTIAPAIPKPVWERADGTFAPLQTPKPAESPVATPAPAATPTAAPAFTAHDRLTQHLQNLQKQTSEAAGERLRQHLEKLRTLASVATEAKESPPAKPVAAQPVASTITQLCPWCSCNFQVEQKDINCGIFRHAQFKGGDFVDPHTPQVAMQQLLKHGLVNGCGNPIRMNAFEGKWKVEKCAWES